MISDAYPTSSFHFQIEIGMHYFHGMTRNWIGAAIPGYALIVSH